MKPTPVPAIITLVVAIVLAGLLAGDLRSRQDKVTISRAQLSGVPLAGFHKLVSDVKWMQFIQFCGSQDKVDANNAAIINDKLIYLVSLDPDFVKAYETGALMLAVETPEKAVGLLKLAINNDALKTNWRLPFLAGFIKLRQVKGDPSMEKQDKENLTAAIGFFSEAMSRGHGESDYVLGSKLHAQSMLNRLEGGNKSPLLQAELLTWFKYFEDNFTAKALQPGDENAGMRPDMMMMGSGVSRDKVVNRIMALAQACHEELSTDQAAQDCTAEIMGKMQSEFHFCGKCFHEYAAGDKFCSACGADVKTFGACNKCGFVTGSKFCTRCGNTIEAEKPAKVAVAIPALPAAVKAAAKAATAPVEQR